MTDSPTTTDPSSPVSESDTEIQGDGGAASSSGRRVLARVLMCLLVLLAGAALFFGWQVRQEEAEEEAREAAVRYASQTAKNLTSVSVDDLDADIEQVLDGATGEFQDDFASRSDNLREVLTTNEVRSEGEVLSVALVRFDEDSATALVVVDALVRNTQNPEGGVNTYRMKLDLERQGDQGLTSTLEFVP